MPDPNQNRLIRESHLDFLSELHENGITLPPHQYDQLVTGKRIILGSGKKKKEKKYIDRASISDVKTELQQRADSRIDIVDRIEDIPGYDENLRHIIMDNDSYDRLSETSLFKYNGGRTITSEDWRPKSKIEHTQEFVHWIDSINRGFQTMVRYKLFAMYCQQSQDWMDEGGSIYDSQDRDKRREYAHREFRRCKENTLYFMDKYLMLKEGDAAGGTMKYDSKPVHKVLCYLVDCGYSIMVGKPRQIAATTTIGGIALCKTLMNRNFFLKMIAQDKEKVIEIFDDKIKYPFGELPDWMKPEVGNDTGTILRFQKKTDRKGTKRGVNSKLQVVAPSVSAINGGAPQLVLVDEAGYIKILGKMIKEARPTMFMQNPITGRLEMRRQIIVWGTAGEVDGGGRSFETEYNDVLKSWNEGHYESGMIPIFFDYTTRPGMTEEHFRNEKKVYTVEGPDKEAKAIQFRQAYPTCIEDMFLTSYKLLVGIDWIKDQQKRILKAGYQVQRGYMEPIYDETRPMDENSDVPFKITGARFVPIDDKDISRICSCWILQHPKPGWKHRYYKGTDPIMTDNGLSNMSSVIFDAYFNTPVAIMDYRDNDHKYTFLQSMLLGIYYGSMEVQPKELVESNIGQAYIDYVDNKGFFNSLVHKTEVYPEALQGGGHHIGVDNRTFRNKLIIDKMYEVVASYGEKFYFPVIFEQLKSFVCKINDNGGEQWGVADPRKFRDDVLFALAFAYICAESFKSFRPPVEISAQSSTRNVVEYDLHRNPDGSLTRRAKVVS